MAAWIPNLGLTNFSFKNLPKNLLSLSILLGCLSCLCQSSEIHEFQIQENEVENENFVRTKRDILEGSQEISELAFATKLNASHLYLMAHWVGQGSPIVFVLARSQTMDSRATSKIYISR